MYGQAVRDSQLPKWPRRYLCIDGVILGCRHEGSAPLHTHTSVIVCFTSALPFAATLTNNFTQTIKDEPSLLSVGRWCAIGELVSLVLRLGGALVSHLREIC